MKNFFVMSYSLLISVLFRIFLVIECYSKLVYHYWPMDTMLYAYEIIFFVLSVPFWLCLVFLKMKKMKKKFNMVLLVSFFPEIMLVLLGPLCCFFKMNVKMLPNVLLYVSIPAFLLFEVSYLVTRFIWKKYITD